MKHKLIATFIILTLYSLCSCTTSGATTGSGTSGKVNEAPPATAENGTSNLSLLEAIEQSAKRIAAELPTGSRVAIVAFESEHNRLSDYIMEELTGALFDCKIEVADRQNLEYVYRELNFQMSGDVSDESAQSIGKFLGAELVIAGQLRHLGSTYRFTLNAIRVETAIHASIPRFNVRNDHDMQRMISALNQQTSTIRTAKYTVSAQTTPETAGTFLDRGILFASRGDYATAVADFSEALRLNPALTTAYILRGRALFASVSTVTAVGDNFSSVDYITSGGQVAAEQVRVYEQAISDFTQALRLDQNNALIYLERGIAYANKGDFDLSITDYTQAIRLNPQYTAAYSNRGNAYADKGDYDRAIADYTQTIRLNPNDAVAYSNRGVAYFDKKDYDRAIADFETALRLDSNFTSARQNLETARLARGRE